ncbi:MAG: CPBP family intramembrane metalloprotease [Symploca sp. SIO2E9]|nr:CPBP family intramembrane metalloprotease [Symploca sp. SIO2E9]
MRIKRLILVLLTIFAVTKVGLSLAESWGQPQIQSRLELYQTNLLLHASQWQGKGTERTTPQQSVPELNAAVDALIGTEPFPTAQKQYQQARQSAQTTHSNITARLQELSSEAVASSTEAGEIQPQGNAITASQDNFQQQRWQQSLSQVEQLINELDLRLGILQAQQGETEAAIKTWSSLSDQSALEITDLRPLPASVTEESLTQTAEVLIGLWSAPPQILADAEIKINDNLDSWFRYRALSQLYQLQQRQDQLSALQTKELEVAQQAVWKLALIGGIPGFGGLLGVGILIFLLAQLLLQGKRSLLATNADLTWETPWNWEIIWQVLILGFFCIGQLVLPLLFSLLGLNPINYTVRMKAFYVLFSYLLMAGGGFLILFLSIKPFLPLPEEWFRLKLGSNWIFWGVGGYLVALPLVIVVSLINQQLWQGQGGSNPILPLALEGRDNVALFVFFLTACAAAPIFEEIIFRGFLLPSLTRYLPVWSSIVASSLLFAIAHLSLSEVLPLATLGIVLGVVYTRSRNLLAPMLLHSLWNSGTLLSLFILGSGSN